MDGRLCGKSVFTVGLNGNWFWTLVYLGYELSSMCLYFELCYVLDVTCGGPGELIISTNYYKRTEKQTQSTEFGAASLRAVDPSATINVSKKGVLVNDFYFIYSTYDELPLHNGQNLIWLTIPGENYNQHSIDCSSNGRTSRWNNSRGKLRGRVRKGLEKFELPSNTHRLHDWLNTHGGLPRDAQ